MPTVTYTHPVQHKVTHCYYDYYLLIIIITIIHHRQYECEYPTIVQDDSPSQLVPVVTVN